MKMKRPSFRDNFQIRIRNKNTSNSTRRRGKSRVIPNRRLTRSRNPKIGDARWLLRHTSNCDSTRLLSVERYSIAASWIVDASSCLTGYASCPSANDYCFLKRYSGTSRILSHSDRARTRNDTGRSTRSHTRVLVIFEWERAEETRVSASGRDSLRRCEREKASRDLWAEFLVQLHAGKRRVRFDRGKRKQGEQGRGDPESSAEGLAVPPYKEVSASITLIDDRRYARAVY